MMITDGESSDGLNIDENGNKTTDEQKRLEKLQDILFKGFGITIAGLIGYGTFLGLKEQTPESKEVVGSVNSIQQEVEKIQDYKIEGINFA